MLLDGRGGERLAATLEWVVMGAATVIYAASFRLGSPVNGLGDVEELFHQDSRYVLRALDLGIPYEWNAQNHVLYHFLTEHGFRALSPLIGEGMPAAFRFLKLVTAATGLGFLLLLRRLFVENGLVASQRVARLLLAAFSLALWFHFAAFETFGLSMPFCVGLLLALHRRLRSLDSSWKNRALLIGSLLFACWTRSDQLRLAVGVGVAMLMPGAKPVRRTLCVDLLAFAVLAPLGYSLIAWAYYGGSPADALRRLTSREDHHGLDAVMMTVENLKPHGLWRSIRANGLYSFVMPLSPHPWPFSADTRGYFREPLSLLAPAATLLVLARTAWLSLRETVKGDVFHSTLWFMWISGTLFYAWFDADEPFLWTVQFSFLTLAALGATGKGEARRATLGIAVTGALVAVHNAVYFVLRYQ